MRIRIFIFAMTIGLSVVLSAFADEPAVDEIVRKANHMALYQGKDSKGRVALVITDKQGRVRERRLNMLRKNDGGKNCNQKYFAFFQAPADVRKMVFMVHKHAALKQDDDRWLYMPSLDLVKRIAASDKRTSFVGSHFLYEDISGRSVLEDVHELIQTTDRHYVVKNTPKSPENVEFAYYIAHIDKKTFLPIKTEYFKKEGQCYRVIAAKQVENIEAKENGRQVIYPTITESTAEDLESGGKTTMTVSAIRYNVGLGDHLFTERYLRRPPRDAMR
jgi:hypothetical protein